VCERSHALLWLLVALAFSGLIGWIIHVGRIWGGRGSGKAIIERSEDPFSFWTQLAVVATMNLFIYILAWREFERCFSN